MNVVVIGATGKTGKLVTQQLLEQQLHSVTVLARYPEALGEYQDKVTVITGDATQPEAMRRALAGQQAVISTLGTSSLKDTNLETAFIKALLEVVAESPINRFINLSAWGTGDSADNHYLIMKIMRRTLLKNMLNDKDRAEALLSASPLAYINVRPSRLSNGPARGSVIASLDGSTLKHGISRADVAAFLVAQLSSDEWLRKSPLIGYPK